MAITEYFIYRKNSSNNNVTDDQTNKIITDTFNRAANILSNRIDASKKYSIEATPTIIINEKKLEGSVNFKNIEKKINKLI